MKAYQRVVREQLAVEDNGDLFGRWWEHIDTDISRAEVREIDIQTAATIILRYEWMGSMPAVVLHCYGIYFDGHLGGAVVYSPEYAENLGVWDRYGYTGRIILLARGASAHWAPAHAGSKLIRRSMDLLPSKYEVVTATVDQQAGEVGTIYQACGFHYVGRMRADNPLSHTVTATRSIYRRGDERIAGRTARRLDTDDLEREVGLSKGRYFAFRGGRSAKRKHLSAIAPLLKDYPRRGLP
jgi:hypothetical protein